MQWDENFDIGADTGTPVTDDYQVPFRFTGKLSKLTLAIERPKLHETTLLETAQQNASILRPWLEDHEQPFGDDKIICDLSDALDYRRRCNTQEPLQVMSLFVRRHHEQSCSGHGIFSKPGRVVT